ncbi:MAG: DUF2330 domain-containing protein [Alphaproteobacteria bacterium]
MRTRLRLSLAALGCAAALALPVASAAAFCGFYVAQAGTSLFNQASKVVLVRDGDRTTITMANDYQGELTEFAIVIPVPSVLDRDQIDVAEPAVIDHLDAYTAPRLVEYHDFDPCNIPMPTAAPLLTDSAPQPELRANSLGVTIEAQYTVGEYDILILSADESAGLQLWLSANGYQVPQRAEPVLRRYLEAGMKFFVARVNLKQQTSLGFSYLRPLQISFRSPAFMLPIHLGMINAAGPQELFVFALSRRGRVETANYPVHELPAGVGVPLYIEDEFADFYKALFDLQVENADMRAVFLEYAWDMSWCDPCAADPLSDAELAALGVDWLAGGDGAAPDVHVTRLHLRYTAEAFPEDLMFRETDNRENFQGRYILNHPWSGEATCPEAEAYLDNLPDRFRDEAENLTRLTGWDFDTIRQRMAQTGQAF